MSRFIITTITMMVFWVALSGVMEAFYLGCGVVSSLLTAWLGRGMMITPGARLSTEAGRIGRFVLYVPWLLKEIVKANLDVARLVLDPRMPINPRMIGLRTGLTDDLAIVTLANSITLTPGTVTVEAREDGGLLVHAITDGAEGGMLEMVRRTRWIGGYAQVPPEADGEAPAGEETPAGGGRGPDV